MTRRVGLIIVAVVLALAGTIAVYSYAHNADKRAVQNTRAAKVLIAQKTVPAGTTWSEVIKGSYLAVETIPADSAPSNALQSLDAPVGLSEVATAGIPSGQVVIRPMFGVKAPNTGAVHLAKGNLAISVSIPSNADVAGYVESGSQVAIFLTSEISFPKGKAPTSATSGQDNKVFQTKLLLPRVDVIATSQNPPSNLNGAKDQNNNNSGNNVLVTLSLSQVQAERVILGQQVGQLYLGLLSQDSVTGEDPGVTNIDVSTVPPVPIFVK